MSGIKKLILALSLFIIGGFTFAVNTPTFSHDFANYLTDSTPDRYGRVETVFNICIDREISLMENIKRLFYPNLTAVDSSC